MTCDAPSPIVIGRGARNFFSMVAYCDTTEAPHMIAWERGQEYTIWEEGQQARRQHE